MQLLAADAAGEMCCHMKIWSHLDKFRSFLPNQTAANLGPHRWANTCLCLPIANMKGFWFHMTGIIFICLTAMLDFRI